MALVKLVDSASFFDKDEQLVTVIDFDSSQGILKQATDSRVEEYVSQINPDPKYMYLHIIAMGSGEYFGANRNADIYYENNLIKSHKTFETSPAHIFKNHVNKDPSIAIGKVIFSIYNNRMKRVELIAALDKMKGADVVDRINRGDWPSTSMACRTPADTCSICGNVARTRQEYCTHLRNELGKVYPDGRKVMAINDHPLKFFDISIVVRPADPTSSILQKVASDNYQIIGSAEAAENEGLLEEGIDKQATIQKLSEFIKEIDGGSIVDSSPQLDSILKKVVDPDIRLIPHLANFKLPEVLNSMAHLGISPSIAFLAELIARKEMGETMFGVGKVVEEFIKELGPKNIPLPVDTFSNQSTSAIPTVLTMLSSSVDNSSLSPQYVEKRASYIQDTNVGYMGNGPHIEPTPYERFRANNLANQGDEHNNLMKMMKTILSIGGAALVAKWYITKQIEQKMYEQNNAKRDSQVKIILVKTASDYKVTYRLAKAAMVNALKS